MENQELENYTEITSIDQAIELVRQWHLERLEVLKHFLDIPEGTEVSMNGEADIPLTGDTLKGFLMGIIVGLDEFSSFPFHTVTEELGNLNMSPDEQAH